MRKRIGLGPFVVAAAVVGAILVALPYFGLGPDTSPDASSYLERRYGNIGIGLAVIWLGLMAVTFGVGVTLTTSDSSHRSPGGASRKRLMEFRPRRIAERSVTDLWTRAGIASMNRR